MIELTLLASSEKDVGKEMKSSNIISMGNNGFLHSHTQDFSDLRFRWKVGLTYIKLNSQVLLQARQSD